MDGVSAYCRSFLLGPRAPAAAGWAVRRAEGGSRRGLAAAEKSTWRPAPPRPYL